MNQQLSFHCHAYNLIAKLKSCSVWCFSGKKAVVTWGAWGHLALPQSEALLPHTPLQEQKWKNQAFLAFYIFYPAIQTPTLPPPKKK